MSTTVSPGELSITEVAQFYVMHQLEPGRAELGRSGMMVAV
jgi:hypothetical protein